MATLEEIRDKITVKRCRWCGENLDTNNIEMYTHEGGWTVDGVKGKQWLYITCHIEKCHGYEWALWELGVPRE